jgi:hypothetical protein
MTGKKAYNEEVVPDAEQFPHGGRAILVVDD